MRMCVYLCCVCGPQRIVLKYFSFVLFAHLLLRMKIWFWSRWMRFNVAQQYRWPNAFKFDLLQLAEIFKVIPEIGQCTSKQAGHRNQKICLPHSSIPWQSFDQSDKFVWCEPVCALGLFICALALSADLFSALCVWIYAEHTVGNVKSCQKRM